jgi:exopolysaccharide production protein ExoZ
LHHETNTGKLDWIQALRGVAALLVVLCHGREYLSHEAYFPWLQTLLLPGAMGVDLFFIISGFIMIYATRNSDGSVLYATKFAVKRFSRIWPVYAVATLIWIYASGQVATYIHSLTNIVVFFKSIFFLPINQTRALFFEPTLPLGWTLNFEMYFYLIFTVAILFGRFKLPALVTWVVLTVVALPMVTRTFSIHALLSYEYSFSYLNLVASPIIFEFLAGALIAQLYLTDWIVIRNKVIAWNLLAASVAFVIWYNYAEFGVLHGIDRWGGSLAIMVLMMAIVSKTVELNLPRFIVWIGEISFSLYLTHLSTRLIVDGFVTKHGMAPMMASWSYILLTTVISIAVAGVAHKYLEVGLSEWFRRKVSAVVIPAVLKTSVLKPSRQAEV